MVCDRPVSIAPSTISMLDQGWAPVCTHDAWRFRRLFTYQVQPKGSHLETAERIASFARRHRIAPDDVERVLPPELEWLEGVVA